MHIKEPKTNNLSRVLKRRNREDPAKEKEKEGVVREEENRENVVSQEPRVDRF